MFLWVKSATYLRSKFRLSGSRVWYSSCLYLLPLTRERYFWIFCCKTQGSTSLELCSSLLRVPQVLILKCVNVSQSLGNPGSTHRSPVRQSSSSLLKPKPCFAPRQVDTIIPTVLGPTHLPHRPTEVPSTLQL